MTERELRTIMEDCIAALKLGEKKISSQAAQIEKLTSERDLFSSEAEHWRTLAYKLAQPRELQSPHAFPAGWWQCM